MKTILILRHAKSSWKDEGLPDRERPLNKRGRREAPEMGQRLKAENLVPERIMSSPAKRAQATAEAAATACGFMGKIETKDRFYPGDPEDYIKVLRGLPADCQRVMVVGHNPGMEALLQALTGQVRPLATAALAQVELPLDHWKALTADGTGRLVNLWTPGAED
jgi:phosphohistidine phosphatase